PPAERREPHLGARRTQARVPLAAHRAARDLRRRRGRRERATDHPGWRRQHPAALGTVPPLKEEQAMNHRQATRPRGARALAVLLGGALAATATSGCVTIAEHRKLEREVLAMQRGGTGTRVADLGAQLAEIERRLGAIEGRLEEVSHDAGLALEEARKARAD